MMAKPFPSVFRLSLFLSILILIAGCGGGSGGGGTKGGGEEMSDPVILHQPADKTVPLNVQADFSVSVVGEGLTFQWQRSDDSGTTWNPISGATTAFYSIASAEKMTASFRCIVTNTTGSVTSDAAEFAVVTVAFVSKDVWGGGDGTDWGKAYPSLDDALNNAPADSEIWVAKGTYTPGPDRGSTFTLKAGVGVYGGFAGSETCREARDWEENETILSGDIDGNDSTADPASNANNSYHVVTCVDVDGAILDGFIITAGNADGITPRDCGGGMYIENSSPVLTDCAFSGNAARFEGGAMYNEASGPVITGCTFAENSAPYGGGMINYDSAPTLTDCTFTNNSSLQSGGGMLNRDGSCPTLADCTFSGNSAANEGGGMCNEGQSSPTLTGCTFSGNAAGSNGGAISCHEYSNPVMVRCKISENTASSRGGGMYVSNCGPLGELVIANCVFSGNSASSGGGICASSSTPILLNCTVVNNSAENLGGGMYNCDEGISTLTNCIIWGNMATDYPRQISDDGESPYTVAYSCLQGCKTQSNNIPDDPLLNDDLTLQAESPCIDAGDSSAVDEEMDIDLAGNPRISGTAVDMGAYEYQQ